MSDRAVVVLAVAAWIGALAAWHAPVLLAGLATAALWALRRPWLFIAAVTVLVSGLGAHALDGLAPPPPAVVYARWATLLTDPTPATNGGVSAEARLGRRHVEVFARGPTEAKLAPLLAGERVEISGVLRALSPAERGRLLPRHIAVSVSLRAIGSLRPANILAATANRFRRVVFRGATALPESLRPLFGGMVIGDARGQSPELADAFRAAGLTHLLVVSGENVAFALLVAAPLIRRGRLWWRFVATLAVLFAFGTLTRWEPSVLRAEAMAAIAAAGALVGRPVPAGRLLALAVTGCIVVDPLLVHSVGFQLSVAACTGLVVLTPPLRRRRVPLLLAASIGAQLGASVVLVPTFGAVPLVSLPANVLAVPAAGPLMMWGLTAGTVAGVEPRLAPLLHAPTHLALWWVATVATHAAGLPIAPIGALGALVAGVAVMTVVAWPRLAVPSAAALAVIVAMAARGPSAVADLAVAPGVSLWVVGGRSVAAVTGPVPPAAVDALRARRVHRLDILVITQPGKGPANAAWPLIAELHPRVMLAPEHHQVAGAYTARVGASVALGAVAVRVTDAGPPLQVTVSRAVYGQARDPPPR